MKSPVVMLLWCGLLLPVPALAEVLDCTARDAVALNEEGLMSQTPVAKYELTRHAAFTADLATGTIEGPELKRQQWVVAVEGSPRDDTVFVAALELEAATSDFFLFRTWSIANANPPVRFLRYFRATVISGTCVPGG